MSIENNDLLNYLQLFYKPIQSLYYKVSDTLLYWISDYIFPNFSQDGSYTVSIEKLSILGSMSKQFTSILAYFTLVFFLLIFTQILYRSSKFLHKTESLESNLVMLYLSVIPYGIPFLEVFNNFGRYTMPHLPISLQLFYNDHVRPILENSYIELNIVYVILLFSQYVIFIQPKRLSKFTRYHMLHSLSHNKSHGNNLLGLARKFYTEFIRGISL